MADDEQQHYPPGQEPEKPAEPEKPEAPPEEKPEAKTPAPEAEKPEEKPEDKPADPPAVPPIKKRSIYDEYKDKKQEARDWKGTAIAALKAQGIELKGDETPDQLRELVKEHKPAPAPEPEKPAAPSKPEKPADELEAFAEEQGLEPAALKRLTEIIQSRIPAAELSEEDKTALATLKDWRAEQQRTKEDQELDAAAPTVKALAKDLGFEIHDEGEVAAIMAEVKRLAHTTEFHDKPVDYIVFAKRAELSKMVSPKKPSFEPGTGIHAEGADEKIDFGDGSKVTPEQAAKHANRGTRSSYEIRRAQ